MLRVLLKEFFENDVFEKNQQMTKNMQTKSEGGHGNFLSQDLNPDSRLRNRHRNRTTRATGESSVDPDNGGTRG